MKRTYAVIGMIALLVAVGTFFALSQTKSEKMLPLEPTSPKTSGSNPTSNTAPVRLIIGDPQAKLAIVEYSDPQCPICKRFFDQTEPQLLREYIDTGRAYLEVKVETHIGEGSQLAGEAWYCAAEQEKFKQFHDQTFTRQGKVQFTPQLMKTLAAAANLDQAKFNQCLDSGKYAQTVKNSHEESKTKISSTPTFFIGEQKVVGAQPFSVIKTVIEAELK
jgi:protein-disulfide isomerase